MNLNEFSGLITNLGFPIVLVFIMGKYFIKYLDKMIQTFQDYIKEERGITAQKYEDAMKDRERQYEIQIKIDESLKKISETQLEIIGMLNKTHLNNKEFEIEEN